MPSSTGHARCRYSTLLRQRGTLSVFEVSYAVQLNWKSCCSCHLLSAMLWSLSIACEQFSMCIKNSNIEGLFFKYEYPTITRILMETVICWVNRTTNHHHRHFLTHDLVCSFQIVSPMPPIENNYYLKSHNYQVTLWSKFHACVAKCTNLPERHCMIPAPTYESWLRLPTAVCILLHRECLGSTTLRSNQHSTWILQKSTYHASLLV